MFDLVVPYVGDVVMLGVDDTLARKRGLKMFGTGMHHDPLLSSRGKAINNWGHSWIMLGVIVECVAEILSVRWHADTVVSLPLQYRTHRPLEVRRVVGGKVGELLILGVTPTGRDRIQLGGVGRQPFELDVPDPRCGDPLRGRTMYPPAIPADVATAAEVA